MVVSGSVEATKQTGRISVVTPNLNLGAYLPSTIESVLTNLSPGDEYFVIDGGSTDGSVDVIREYESRLTGWVSEPDRGHADAIAKGFTRATGDILCWINSGDLLLPGALDAARRALSETGAEMIFGDDLYADEHGRVIFYSRGYVKDLKQAMLYGGWTPLQDACFWTRALYERVGGINPLLKHAVDYDLFLRMGLEGTTQYVSLTFSVFRRHCGQKSIAQADAYQTERAEVRRRHLAQVGGSLFVKSFRLLWHGTAIRWRVHVSQQRWHRPDLVGRPIDELRCGELWPSPKTA
jgi:glycosyltransferase involved in cell wall biosynthesis